MTLLQNFRSLVTVIPTAWANKVDIRRVDTIADLRGIPVSYIADGDQCTIGCYATAGDGGGGNFRWNASSADADDNGITILPTGHVGNGRWKRVYVGAVNIKWFGAAGDGVTDDSSARSSAVDASEAVYFPTGIYIIGSQKSVTSKPVTFFGDGIEQTEIRCSSNFLSVNNSALLDNTTVQFRDMTISTTNAGTDTAVTVTGTVQRTLVRAQFLAERVVFRGTTATNSWQKPLSLSQVSDSQVSNCAFVGNRDDWSDMAACVSIDTSVDVVFFGNRCYWGTKGVVTSGDTEGLTVSHNHIVGFDYAGVHANGSGGPAMMHVVHNHMNTNQFGVLVETTDATRARHSDISDNNLLHNVPSLSLVGGAVDYNWIGIKHKGENSVISSNQIEGSTATSDTGVVLTAECDKCVVNGNTLEGCSAASIQVDAGATDNVVTSNAGTTPAVMINNGTRTRTSNNSSEIWTDEVHGGATVTNGTTSVAVNHTLSSTPSIADIHVTARTWGNAAKAWVSNVTSTQFTLNVDVDPGAGQATFTWWAKTAKSNL
jgi:hypothetical protein